MPPAKGCRSACHRVTLAVATCPGLAALSLPAHSLCIMDAELLNEALWLVVGSSLNDVFTRCARGLSTGDAIGKS